ncbi:hypothetical protein BU15DRAFT_76057 [Melanogaster broomeanus]|nr:hypothetical protein BU15DRAFT_76057 [Melanogaster broomeanus]
MAGPHETTLAPMLGGKAAFVLFIAVLLAFVIETQTTQYLQTTLGYRQSYFIFYIVHSSFSLSFPIHLIYVLLTTKHGLRPLLSGLHFAITTQLTSRNSEASGVIPRSFPLAKSLIFIISITALYSIPALLWFAAVPLASVTDVTAIWNANAFFAYIFSVRLLRLKWSNLRLFAVSMATLGVLTVVYGGTTSSPGPESYNANLISASGPFIGDMLTLVASVGYGFYQVLYKKYVALPTDPELASESVPYRRLSSSADNEEVSAPAIAKDNLIYPPPFGLHPNLITASIGLCTLLVFWIPIPILHYYQIEEFRLPPNLTVVTAIAGIAASGVVFNAGFMILLGIWGPVVTSVGNLLTIVLTLISDLIFGTVAPTLEGSWELA